MEFERKLFGAINVEQSISNIHTLLLEKNVKIAKDTITSQQNVFTIRINKFMKQKLKNLARTLSLLKH